MHSSELNPSNRGTLTISPFFTSSYIEFEKNAPGCSISITGAHTLKLRVELRYFDL